MRDKLLFKILVILNNTVMDKKNWTSLMRMGVIFSGITMRSPTSMTNAEMIGGTMVFNFFLKIFDFTNSTKQGGLFLLI